MKKLISALLCALFILGVCVLPLETQALKTSFSGEVGKSYKEVVNSVNINLGNPKVTVKVLSGGSCLKNVSATIKKTTMLDLMLNFSCEQAGEAELYYSFTYEYNGKSFSQNNNITVKVTGGGGSGSSSLPVITKHPGGETVEEGGKCNFIAHANDEDGITWYFTKGSKTVKATEASKQFKGLKVSGVTEDKLKLSNIPLSLNGWKIYAKFENSFGTVDTKKASIKVTEKPKEKEKEKETPTAAPKSETPVSGGSAFAFGVDCDVNGAFLCTVKNKTKLHCTAHDIEGMVFDHWELNGMEDYSAQGPEADFTVSETTIVRAIFRKRCVIKTFGAHMQFMDAKGNPSGDPFTVLDFEDDYKNLATGKTIVGGSLCVYVTADVPQGKKLVCWNIDGAPIYFPETITSFEVWDLTAPASYEAIFG